ncbi:MAG: isoprenylcysteine carboxylmethyltransferase family protein, partial [Bacteroidales bacterium]|nr:isoprenylcysteine carboxylmethyltransferase family protein [Bacteroidales bacterium]
EKIGLGLILIFFILAFAIRNIKTYISTKQSIRGKSLKLTVSILTSTIIYLVILLRLTILPPDWIFEMDFEIFDKLEIVGYGLVILGFGLGIFALVAMKNSWRVGIKYEQKTKLVSSGIYRFSRNPYFLSYSVLILGYILIFPSMILIGLLILLATVFHKMILEEEKYLELTHGDKYLDYKRKVNRYITLR